MRDGRLSATLEQLFRERTAQAHGSLQAWKGDLPSLCRAHSDPADLAIAGGFRANCVGYAFMAGYQAALRTLVPTLPPDALCAICVTEAEGNHPRAIQTTLSPAGNGYALRGAKSFVTGGTLADTLLVAARTGDRGDRPVIRLVRVEADAAGVSRTSMPPLRFVPEIDHASVQFDDAAVDGDALLPGDGYTDYVKPFRTMEDSHVSLAVTGYLLHRALDLETPPAIVEDALACLVTHARIATLDPASPATHLALAGARRQFEGFVPLLEAHWRRTDASSFALWQRDRALLEVAGSARTQRLARAREQLLGARSR